MIIMSYLGIIVMLCKLCGSKSLKGVVFISNHDSDYFDALYRENHPRMVKLATYLLNNQQIAEDLVNEAFLIFLYKQSKLVAHPNISGWLSQTLKNLIADELKSARNRLELPLYDEIDIPAEDKYEQSLYESLPEELPPLDRAILTLFYEKQLPHAEIARYLNISVLSCRTRLYRAKKRCSEILHKHKQDYFS